MKKRILSGVIGGIIAIIAVIFHNTVIFNIFAMLISVLAMYEAMYTTRLVRNNALFIAALLFAAVAPYFPWFGVEISLFISVIYAVSLLVITLKYHAHISIKELSYTFMMSMVIPLSFTAACILANGVDGWLLMFITVGGAWFCDIGAYFVGSFFGKHKMAPVISPKKTFEGAIGGIVVNMVLFIIIGIIWSAGILDDGEKLNWVLMLLLSVITAVMGMLGDLMFSFIKRKTGVKDFGNIIPGHGGALDRFDSIVATAPVVLAIIQLFPIVIRVVS